MMKRPNVHISNLASALRAPARSVRRAFTIFELLITISIIILATVIVLPAFGRIIESANFAGAVNTVTATLGNARALAIKNNQHTAVAFLFDTELESGTYTLLTLEVLAENGAAISLYASGNAATPGSASNNVYSYMPAEATVPVVLPRGTAVYGLSFNTAPAGELIDAGGGGTQETRHWYAGEVFLDGVDIVTPWIFPRNDPRHFMPDGADPYEAIRNGAMLNDADTALRHAQSFMIQFSPEGTIVESYSGNGIEFNTAYIEYPNIPRDDMNGTIDPLTGEAIPYDNALAFDPENRFNLTSNEDVQANPEVVLRSVSQLAIVSFAQLGEIPELRGIEDPWFVRPTQGRSTLEVAPIRDDLQTAGRYYDFATVRAVSQWIDNNAEIISFNRFSGNIVRRED